MATLTEARDDMFGVVQTFWDGESTAPTVLVYQDNPGDRPKDTVSNEVIPWARASIQHNLGYQASLSNEGGVRRHRQEGLLTVELWYPQADGMTAHDAFAQLLMVELRGTRTTNDVILRNVRLIEVGPDGPWHKSNVVADFEYDHIS